MKTLSERIEMLVFGGIVLIIYLALDGAPVSELFGVVLGYSLGSGIAILAVLTFNSIKEAVLRKRATNELLKYKTNDF